VTPDARTSGLGRRLVRRVLVYARDNGVERVVLNTLPTMTNAIALYQSLGFNPIDPYVTEPTVGVLYFGLDLTPDL
jgi:ribosomal protein S18 acetylase RimI-like enzyme